MITDFEVLELAAEMEPMLSDRATVYDDDPVTGAWTVVLKADLKCWLQPENIQPQAASFDRPEVAGLRKLKWERGYFLRNDAQVEVAGLTRTRADGTTVTQRWNVVNNTQTPIRAPGSDEVIRWTCQVVEAVV